MEEYVSWHKKLFSSMNGLACEMYWSFTCDAEYDWSKYPDSLACVREKLVTLVDLVDESPYGDHVRGQWYRLLMTFDVTTKEKGSFKEFYNDFYSLGKYFANVMHRVEAEKLRRV